MAITMEPEVKQTLPYDLSDKTIERIQALMNVTDHRGASENEAAVAQRHVMRILAKYNLSMGEFEKLANPVEDIKENRLENPGRSIPMWKTNLLNAIGEAHFCDLYISNGYRYKTHVLVGRPTNVQACKIVYAYLVDVVDTATKDALKTYTGWETPKTFANSFRMGMVARIRERFCEEMKNIHRDNVAEAEAKARSEEAEALGLSDENQEPRAIGEGSVKSYGGSSNTSIVVANIYEEAQKEVKAFYESKGIKLSSMGYSGSTGSGAGYNAGRKAGNNIPLHSSSALNRRNS